MNGNHVYRQASRPEREQNGKQQKAANQQFNAMAANGFLLLFAIISQPEHRQHEVDIVYIAVGQDVHQYDGDQRRHPKATQEFEADIPYQVAEKDGFKKPYGIEESPFAEVHHFRIGVVARQRNKGIHDKECCYGRDD